MLGACLLGAYVVLLAKLIGRLTPDELAVYRRTGSAALNAIVMVAAPIAFLLLRAASHRLILLGSLFLFMIVFSLLHNRRVAREKLPDGFSGRLIRLSLMAMLGFGCVVAAFAVSMPGADGP